MLIDDDGIKVVANPYPPTKDDQPSSVRLSLPFSAAERPYPGMDITQLTSELLDENRRLLVRRARRARPSPNWRIPPRCHGDSLLYLMLNGSCSGKLDGHDVQWKAPQLWWVAPNVPHEFHYDHGRELDFFVMRWNFDSDAWPQRVICVEDSATCRPLFQALTHAYRFPVQHHQELRFRCALVQLLIAVVDAAQQPGAGHQGLTMKQRQLCYEYLSDNIAFTVTPEDLALACHLGLGHFRRRFKVTFGVSPRAWLASERIQHAAALLRDSEMGVEEAAQACGYASLPSFSRCFKQVMGASPTRWLSEIGER